MILVSLYPPVLFKYYYKSPNVNPWENPWKEEPDYISRHKTKG